MIMAETIVVSIWSSVGADGQIIRTARGQLFDGMVDGRMIVRRSMQPLRDGGRALLAEGVDPATQVVVRLARWGTDIQYSTVGVAAKMVANDNHRAAAAEMVV